MRGAAAAALLALAAAGCAKPPPRTFTVTIAQMAFGPTPSDARVGDVIQWVNADIFQHTATARDGGFDVDLPPKASARTTLRRAGAIAFYCRYHPGMSGSLTVAD